ncbi:MAG: Gfo/Idh/MocA family oxidoreductase [Clostridia bacterium]|nr:Gfo/Idh/MocA family oxidoreductase [Clostridia bacterium]
MNIGFVDYYLSEWHANNYPAWIKEASDELCVKYAWAEEYVSPVDNVNTDEWCEKYGVEKCNTLAELCEKSDFIIILSPSNPEKHLEYAKEVLKHGKNTYIDKTFTPSYEEAAEIFSLAKQYGTKFFSTSALRYASELETVAESQNLITTGGGSNLEEYVIHQIEMAVKTVKAEPMAIKLDTQGNQIIWTVAFDNGGRWTGIYSPYLPFTVCGDKGYQAVTSKFFPTLISTILDFFKTGALPFDTEETLKAMKIRDAILKAYKLPGEWLNV